MSNSKQQTKSEDAKWGWYVWPNDKSLMNSKTSDNDFEVVQQEAHQSTDQLSLGQYVNLVTQNLDDRDTEQDDDIDTDNDNNNNDNTDSLSQSSASDHLDEETVETNAKSNEKAIAKEKDNDDDEKDSHDTNDAVMISQTLTLRTRNEELEKECDQLQSETLQLRMQTECLRQTNDHIIAAQQQEIEKLQADNHDLGKALNEREEEFKAAKAQIAMLVKERDNLKKKLHEVCYNRLNVIEKNESVEITKSEVLARDKHAIYGCIHCGQRLFDSKSIIQREIEMDDHSFGLIVNELFNTNDATMGPTVCKTFLNGMYKVREMFCDSCLNAFGWKICEAFDEWNSFYSNKFCIDISNIKQISIAK